MAEGAGRTAVSPRRVLDGEAEAPEGLAWEAPRYHWGTAVREHGASRISWSAAAETHHGLHHGQQGLAQGLRLHSPNSELVSEKVPAVEGSLADPRPQRPCFHEERKAFCVSMTGAHARNFQNSTSRLSKNDLFWKENHQGCQ